MAKRVLVVVFWLAVSASGMMSPSYAAVGSLQGKVFDPLGKPVDGAEVEITPTDQSSQTPVKVKTRSDGSYLASELLLGNYRMTIKGGKYSATLSQFVNTTLTTVDVTIGPDSKPTWNVWVSERTDESKQLSQLKDKGLYMAHFDLASFGYSAEVPATQASLDLEDYLDDDRNLKLAVKPLLLGEGLKIETDEDGSCSIPSRVLIKRDRLKGVKIENFKNITLAELSEKANAVSVDICLRAVMKGDAIIGLSIWDIDRRRPLDFLTLAIKIGDQALEPTVAMSQSAQQRPTPTLHSGLGSLLNPYNPEAKAGLGIFTFPKERIDQDEFDQGNGSYRNVVVYFDTDGKLLSWTPRRSIREYVDDIDPKHFGLNRQLEFVHCPSWASLDCEEDYSQVASFFSEILFSDSDKKGRGEAKLAKENLQKLGENAVVSVGYFNGAGTILPIPLGLLGVTRKRAKGQEGMEETVLLGSLATVTQQLPTTRLPKLDQCAEDFTAVLPTSLGMDGQDVRTDFDALLRPYSKPASRIISIDKMRTFLEAQSQEKREGLLLLAHHVDGFLSFDADFHPAYLAEEIERRFAPGSVAILIGCSVGGLDSLNRTMPLISTLNKQGIDAMILSPFGVNAQLGARFAVHFTAEIESARKLGAQPTLLQVFQLAVERTRGDALVAPFLGELNEFLIAGAGDLKLCPQKVKATPTDLSAVPNPPPAGQPQPTDPPAVDPDPEEPPPRVTSQRDSASCGWDHGRGQGRRLGGGSGPGGGGVKPGGRIGPFQRDFGGYGWGCCCCCD